MSPLNSRLSMSLINSGNRIGPSSEPCRTPHYWLARRHRPIYLYKLSTLINKGDKLKLSFPNFHSPNIYWIEFIVLCLSWMERDFFWKFSFKYLKIFKTGNIVEGQYHETDEELQKSFTRYE